MDVLISATSYNHETKRKQKKSQGGQEFGFGSNDNYAYETFKKKWLTGKGEV
jgi:hypothetical protein